MVHAGKSEMAEQEKEHYHPCYRWSMSLQHQLDTHPEST
jgi:hypothetical protein